MAGARGFWGSTGDLLIPCVNKQQSQLLLRGGVGYSFDHLELFEWELAFAPHGTAQRVQGAVRAGGTVCLSVHKSSWLWV